MSTSESAAPSAETSASPSGSCVDTTYAALTPEQRRGQLVMIALQAGAPSASLKPLTSGSHIGNVIYLGGWQSGTADISATSKLLQAQATQEATGGVQMLLAADQEGGQVQQFKNGFTRIPSALTQSGWAPEEITRQATEWGKELKAVGVNLDLAPVTDTVPAELGRGNGPIGQWDRQYGYDPATVARGANAFIAGMSAAGVQTSVKHFPGIGRIQGNTDYVATGLDDTVMTVDDPYLQPFVDGWQAGAGLVMMSSATYPNVDAVNPAMFSPAIMTDLLRGRLGFQGVVITDDINAVSVRNLPVADRATRFIDAGGDILLTGDTPSAPALVAALQAKADADPAFAAKVEASVKRVLTLKASMGLIPGCSTT
ncbi:MAG TPA: glycoside hydrolase family 3 N-terminal domain-containing protein [Phycicoccus sp.]|nr:glycoside hydrolase family 3 N-terminal domain-containing protein [Phycicoccus sp.]HQK30331.1 glycoside hydrolase family 3 N-terminal domain-containing protein [Phycicoccus sp.]